MIGVFTIDNPILEKKETPSPVWNSWHMVLFIVISWSIFLPVIYPVFNEWLDRQEQRQQQEIDPSISYQTSGVIQQMLIDSAPSPLSEVKSIYILIINQKEYEISREGYKQLQIGDTVDIQFTKGVLTHLTINNRTH